MFGTYRLFLAIIVVFHHLIAIPVIGHHAVQGFFILSGYLMTFIMRNSYGYSLGGIRRFAVNRFLRLYPAYWMVLILSVLAIYYFGENQARAYRAFIFLPRNPGEIAQNISLIYLNLFPTHVAPRISPPTWALTIELVFYFLIALGLSRSRLGTSLWLAASVLYTAISIGIDLPYRYRYSFILAGSLPFSLGSFLFHFRGSILKIISSLPRFINPATLSLLFLVNSSMAAAGKGIPSLSFYETWGSCLNICIHFCIIAALIEGKYPAMTKALDEKLGNYSYPIYLMHWQVGFVVSMILFSKPVNGFHGQGVISVFVTLVASFGVSFLIIKFVDQPIETIRRRVRSRAKLAST